MADYVVLGKIAEPYGVRGWIKIYPHADDPLDWSKMSVWWVGREKRAGHQIDWLPCELIQCKSHGTTLVALLAGMSDRTAAESLKGALIGAPREDLPQLPPDQFYWADLIGLKVTNIQDQEIGVVAGLIETGANDVLRVVDQGGEEHLLPYVDAVVKAVDVKAGQITVDWGLDW